MARWCGQTVRGGGPDQPVRSLGQSSIIVLVLCCPGVCVRQAPLCCAVDTRSDSAGCMKVATSPQSASVCPGSTRPLSSSSSSYHLHSSPGSPLGLGTVSSRVRMTSVKDINRRTGSSVGYNPLIRRKSRKLLARRRTGQLRPPSPNSGVESPSLPRT